MRPVHKQALFSAPLIHADDTILPLIHEDGHRCAQARVWAYVNAQAAYFEFTDTREGKHPQGFLHDYRGHIQADDCGCRDARAHTVRSSDTLVSPTYGLYRQHRSAESPQPSRRARFVVHCDLRVTSIQ